MCLTEWLFFPLPILNFGAGCASNYTSERHALRAIRKVVKAYPQIPIILVILMDYEESRIRLLKMKKKARRASLLSSIYSHSVFELPSLSRRRNSPERFKTVSGPCERLNFQRLSDGIKFRCNKRLKDEEKMY
jgi:hypothetical protein